VTRCCVLVWGLFAVFAAALDRGARGDPEPLG